MNETIIAAGTTLVTEQCWCGIWHAVPKSLVDNQRRQFQDGEKQTSIHCPIGHGWVIKGESEASKLQRRLTREESRHDQTRAELRETEARRRAEKAAKTRIKNRVAAGVCPCCKRCFQNLGRHMTTKHPGWKD